MNQFKGPVIIGMVVFAAFVWGYKQDSIKDSWQRLTEKKAEPKPEQPAPKAPPPGALGLQPKEQAPVRSVPSAANPYQALPNPYERLMERTKRGPTKPQGSLRGTLDSINPDTSLKAEKVQRKNAYFEKLRQQLKELRGEPPAENASSDKTTETDSPKTEARSREKIDRRRVEEEDREKEEKDLEEEENPEIEEPEPDVLGDESDADVTLGEPPIIEEELRLQEEIEDILADEELVR